MARTSNVFARVEPEIKEQAEQVLDQLGIPMSNAVSMFLRQIVLQRGIPFEMKLPERKPVAFGALTKEQRDAEEAEDGDLIPQFKARVELQAHEHRPGRPEQVAAQQVHEGTDQPVFLRGGQREQQDGVAEDTHDRDIEERNLDHGVTTPLSNG